MNPKVSTLKVTLLSLALAGLLSAYIAFQARNIILGPVISVTTPQPGASIDEGYVLITGTTRNVSSITLNDRTIFVSKDGTFTEQLLLGIGYNVFTLKAFDRFGRKTVRHLELVRTN